MNIIGDIAGQWKTLQALLKQMPDEEPISLGDMVDRGPQSKEVVDFFMKNGRALMGNHEHMMVDACRQGSFYEHGLWTNYNGGSPTLDSFGWKVPDDVLDWASRLPKYMEVPFGEELYFLSHAPFYAGYELPIEGCNLGSWAGHYPIVDQSLIWHRGEPIDRDYTLQLFGHNAHWGIRHFSSNGFNYAMCIDSSKQKVLTGINLPSGDVYQQPYIK